MIARGWWLAGVLSVAALFGCGPSARARPATAVASDASQPAERSDDGAAKRREEWNTLKVKEGDACVAGGEPAMLDSKLRPVDTKNEASLRAAAGHPVLRCARVRRALGGRVVDAATRAPMAGATVTVESWQARPPLGRFFPKWRLFTTADARTAADGSWEMPAASNWEVGVLANDGFLVFISSYCVRAPGYEQLAFDPWQRLELRDGPPPELALHATTVAKDPRPDPARSKCGLPLGPGF